LALLAAIAFGGMSVPARGRPSGDGLPKRYRGSASCIAFSPDGKTLACDLALSDVVTRKEVSKAEYGENHDPCTYVAFSPDGRRLASVHFDRGLRQARHSICLWNVTAGNELTGMITLPFRKLEYHGPEHYRDSLHYLTFSRDGKLLATRHPNDETIVWDTASGKERMRLDTKGHVVAFGPEGKILISVSRDGLVQHWDLATRKCIAPNGESRRTDFLFVVNAFASADGSTVALTDENSVVIKDTRSGKTLRRFDDLGTTCPALSPDGKTLAANDGLFEVVTGKQLARLNEPGLLAFSPDGRSLAVAGSKSVTIWSVAELINGGKGEIKSDRILVPLEAKLTSKKSGYTLDLGTMTPEEFARQINRQGGKILPPSPKVDLVLTIRNSSKKPLALETELTVYLHLVGDGAMNHPDGRYSSFANLKRPESIVLAPGSTYSLPVESLDTGEDRQSYWLLPGDYILHLNCYAIVDPAPEGSHKFSDGSGFLPLHASLRVKVTAQKK
jgi:hypothetical protein